MYETSLGNIYIFRFNEERPPSRSPISPIYYDNENMEGEGVMSYLELLATLGIGSAHPGGFALTKQLLAHEKLTNESRLLDIGCGTGKTLEYIQQMYDCELKGVDIHPVMVEKAKQRFQEKELNIPIQQGNVEQLTFEDNTFDFILSESVLFFTSMNRALSECARVLKKTGSLLGIEMMALKPLDVFTSEELTKVYGVNHLPTEKEWMTTLTNNGFSHMDVLKRGNVQEARPDESEAPDWMPSAIDDELFSTLQQHQAFLDIHGSSIGYFVFRAKK